VNVYRIVQECVNNIMKHSQATEAMLVVKRNGSEITLLVQDNGRGFVKQPASSATTSSLPRAVARGPETTSRGFGLIGIAERVKMLHGSWEIDSDQGTSIRIKIPCDRP